MAPLSEWLQIMLAEIARKRDDVELARQDGQNGQVLNTTAQDVSRARHARLQQPDEPPCRAREFGCQGAHGCEIPKPPRSFSTDPDLSLTSA